MGLLGLLVELSNGRVRVVVGLDCRTGSCGGDIIGGDAAVASASVTLGWELS